MKLTDQCLLLGITLLILHLECCQADFGPWTSWLPSPCSAPCGSGMQSRARQCDSGTCIGDTSETRTCTMPQCQWGNWGPFGSCSATCGSSATGKRSRICENGGIASNTCAGAPRASMQTGPCTLPDCPRWASWGSWSGCSSTCVPAMRTKSRTCIGVGTCLGASSQTSACIPAVTVACPSPVGSWTPWDTVGECSKSCGGGTIRRKRTCTGPGTCPGSTTDIVTCNPQACPTPKWNTWQNWGTCSATCSPPAGTRIRTRTCMTTGCVGSSSETSLCSPQPPPCTSTGTWSKWSRFGPCSNSCGRGTRKRTRKCTAASCSGPNSKTRSCKNCKKCKGRQQKRKCRKGGRKG